MKILIVEDQKDIAKQLADHLKESGFVVHVEHDGEEGHYQGDTGEFDLVLLDIGLPSMDGFSILEKWRKAGKTMPVIILTARNSKMETVRGLELGADDYITKPFDLTEVAARIRSTLRRMHGKMGTTIESGGVVFDINSGRITVNGALTRLTRTEFLMVQYLFMHQGKTVGVNELAEHTYGDFDNDSGIIARHIANIRKKIGADVIKTDSNRGYYVPLTTEK